MIASPCAPDEAACHLAAILGSNANPFGTLSMGELLNGACFAVRDGGQVIGAYVLRGHGSEVWVQAAAGRAGVDLCDLFDDLIAKHGAGFESIGFRTYRRGLVRKALARGYQITSRENGFTMKKAMK
jgi:hypothetical protein